jgi:hypothetical protein
MHIVVADDLPKSALELLKAEGWNVDSKSGRSPEELSKDLADADALVVRSATLSRLEKSCGPLPAPVPALTMSTSKPPARAASSS